MTEGPQTVASTSSINLLRQPPPSKALWRSGKHYGRSGGSKFKVEGLEFVLESGARGGLTRRRTARVGDGARLLRTISGSTPVTGPKSFDRTERARGNHQYI